MDPLNEHVVSLLQQSSDDYIRVIWKDGTISLFITDTSPAFPIFWGRRNGIIFVITDTSRVFPIFWGRRNGFDFLSSTFSWPICPPPNNPTLSISLLHESFHLIFRLLSVAFRVQVHLTLFLARSSLFLTWPYQFCHRRYCYYFAFIKWLISLENACVCINKIMQVIW